MMHRHAILLLLAATAALLSCQKEEESIQEEQTVSEDNTVSVDMVLNGGIRLWDAPQTKATLDWPDGSRLYIQFYNDLGAYLARAIYQAGKETWKLSIDPAALVKTESGVCECYYFENTNGYNSKVINLHEGSCVYEGWGEYSVSENTVTLNVTLAPKTGRIKFTVPSAYPYTYLYPRVHGLSYYTLFDLTSFSFTESEDKYWNFYLDENSGYKYCFFTNPENTVLRGYREGWGSSHFERRFDASVLEAGHSIICEWPVDEAHNEWTKYENPYYPLNYSFGRSYSEFYYMDSGIFTMGGATASPIHSVQLTKNYYIQQWETSRSLWYYALGKPSGWQSDDNPVTGKTWDEIQEFIFALNVKTGQNYRLPTEAEWEWACRGGWLSSGSDYYGSSSPYGYRGNSIQRPGYGNEIGVADMCGNAGEYVQDFYGPYTTAPQIDPKGPATGDYHVIRGGDIKSSDEGITVYARSSEENSLLQYTGFRLAMDVPEMYETYKGAKLYAPSRLPFGNVPVGQTGHTKLTVRASRVEDVTFQIQGSGDGFTYSPSGEITVPAGSVKEVDFSFTPTQTGDKTANFNVVSSSLTAPIIVKVTGTGRSDDEALIVMERKYLLKNVLNNSYSYPRMSICFDNETSLNIGYYNTEYYDGWYHGYNNRLTGTFIYPTSGGNSYQNRTEEPWNPTGLPEEDTWVHEKILVYENADVDYYINDVYMGTHSFATLDLSAVEKIYVQCSPEGSTNNIEHWMDDFSIRTSSGYNYSDNFESEKLTTTFWKVPTNPAGVKQEDGVAKTILRRTDDDYNLTSRNINLLQ